MADQDERGIRAGLLARLRTGTYDEEDLATTTAIFAGDLRCGGLDRDGLVDALIDALKVNEYRLERHPSVVQALAAAGVDERVVPALRDLAQRSTYTRAAVDAAEGLIRLGKDDDAHTLVNVMRRTEDEEDLAYGAARLSALGRADIARDVLLDMAVEPESDVWARAAAAVVAAAHGGGDAAIAALREVSTTTTEHAPFTRKLAVALWDAGRHAEAANVLADLAADTEVDVLYRWQAIELLRERAPDARVGALAIDLARPPASRRHRWDVTIAIEAAIEASRLGYGKEAVHVLLTLARYALRGYDSGFVDAAVQAARLGVETQPIELLSTWAADHGRSGAQRLAAARGLDELGRRELADALLEDLAADEDVGGAVRAQAAVDLGHEGTTRAHVSDELAGRLLRMAQTPTADTETRVEALRGLKTLMRDRDARAAATALVVDPEVGPLERFEALTELEHMPLSDGEVQAIRATAASALNRDDVRFKALRILARAGMVESATQILRSIVTQRSTATDEALSFMRELGLIDELEQACRGADEWTAQAALSELLQARATEAIWRVSADPANLPETRVQAARVLLSSGDARGARVLRTVALATDIDWTTEDSASYAVALGDGLAFVSDNERMTRVSAARALGEPEGSAILCTLACDRRYRDVVRLGAVAALVSSDNPLTSGGEAATADVARAIVRRRDFDPQMRLEAAGLLAELGEPSTAHAVALEIGASTTVNAYERLTALTFVAAAGTHRDEVCAALVRLAQSANARGYTRLEAARTALAHGCPGICPVLTAMMEDAHGEPGTRMDAAILALDNGLAAGVTTLEDLALHFADTPEFGEPVAYRALEELGRRGEVKSLIRIATSQLSSGQQGEGALHQLAQIGVEHLTAIAHNPQSPADLRAAATVIAAKYVSSGTLTETLRGVTDDARAPIEYRIRAAAAMAEDGALDQAVATLKMLLLEADAPSSELHHAASVLGSFGTADEILGAASDPLVPPAARYWLAAFELPALGVIEQATAVLAQLGSSPEVDAHLRLSIATDNLPSLGETSQGVDILIDLAKPDSEVSDQAAAALARFAPTDTLARLAAGEGADDRVRCAAAEGLWRRGRQSAAVAALRDLASNARDPLIKVKACRALAKAGLTEDAMEIAQALLADPVADDALRDAILTVVLEIGG